MKEDINNRLFSIDEATRTKKTFHYDEQDGSFIIDTKQDMEPVLVTANEERKETRGYKGDGFHKVASIPNAIWWDLVEKGIAHDDKALMKWLEDPENKVFKTHDGRLI